jgi:hypothetical protein
VRIRRTRASLTPELKWMLMAPANDDGNSYLEGSSNDTSLAPVIGYSPENDDEQGLLELAELALAGLLDLEAGRILDEGELDALLEISPVPEG